MFVGREEAALKRGAFLLRGFSAVILLWFSKENENLGEMESS